MADENKKEEITYTVDDLTPSIDEQDTVEESEKKVEGEENKETKTEEQQEENLIDIKPVVDDAISKFKGDIDKIISEIEQLKNITDDDLMVDVLTDLEDDEDEEKVKKAIEAKKQEINNKLSILNRKREELEARAVVEASKRILEEYRKIHKDFPDFEKTSEIFDKLSEEEKNMFTKLSEQHPFKALDFLKRKLYESKGRVVEKEKESVKTPTRIDEIRGSGATNKEPIVGGFTQKDYRDMGII